MRARTLSIENTGFTAHQRLIAIGFRFALKRCASHRFVMLCHVHDVVRLCVRRMGARRCFQSLVVTFWNGSTGTERLHCVLSALLEHRQQNILGQ